MSSLIVNRLRAHPAACQAVKNASREGDAILDREVVMGSWIPVD